MPDQSPPESPLDAYLVPFLASIAERDPGFTPGHESAVLAERLQMQRAFVDMLFTSARMRGLLKPAYGRGSKVVWQVSATGQAMIDQAAGDTGGE